jgi:hypothetical protein
MQQAPNSDVISLHLSYNACLIPLKVFFLGEMWGGGILSLFKIMRKKWDIIKRFYIALFQTAQNSTQTWLQGYRSLSVGRW